MRVLVPPAATLAGVKVLTVVGTPGADVFSVAVPVVEVGALVLVTVLVVLTKGPAVLAWTLVTVITQLAPTGRVKPLAATPVVPVRVAAPQLAGAVVMVAPVALTRPVG